MFSAPRGVRAVQDPGVADGRRLPHVHADHHEGQSGAQCPGRAARERARSSETGTKGRSGIASEVRPAVPRRIAAPV